MHSQQRLKHHKRVLSGKKIKTDRMIVEQVGGQIFSMSDDIRYVAVYYRGKLGSVSKPHPAGSDFWDSDRFEEIIVNPTLITLLGQRGRIDCEGIRHVIIQYGNVTQFVHPIDGGHISVGFELKSDYARLIPGIKKLLMETKLIAPNQKEQDR